MKLDALWKWSDPSAAFKEAKAGISEQPPMLPDDEYGSVGFETSATSRRGVARGAGVGGAADQLDGSRQPGGRMPPQDIVDVAGYDPEAERLALPDPDSIRDVRRMSPRQLGEFAHELYMEGVLKWEEYRMVGFPTELHPDWDKTVGALTGKRAQPDEQRDMIQDWQAKADFLARHSGEDAETTKRVERIVSILKWHEIPSVALET